MATEMTEYGWNDGLAISLVEKMKLDLKGALLRQDQVVKDALRQIMAEFPKLVVPIVLQSGKKSSRLKKGEEITNDDVLSIIMGLVKSEKMVLEYKKESSSPYLEVLNRYLPAMIEREAVVAWIAENIDFSQYKSPMQAMAAIMKHFGKAVDGKLVKEILAGYGGN